MEPDDIDLLNYILSDDNITFYFIGELALNYYNMPRIIHLSPFYLYPDAALPLSNKLP
jgi:hypothetical protein